MQPRYGAFASLLPSTREAGKRPQGRGLWITHSEGTVSRGTMGVEKLGGYRVTRYSWAPKYRVTRYVRLWKTAQNTVLRGTDVNNLLKNVI